MNLSKTKSSFMKGHPSRSNHHNNHNSNSNLERSMSNTSKNKVSKGSNLIPIRSVKVAREGKDGKKLINISQSEQNKSINDKSTGKRILNYKERERDLVNLENSINTVETNIKGSKKGSILGTSSNKKVSNFKPKPNLILEGMNTNTVINFEGYNRSENKSRMRNKMKGGNVDIYNLYKVCSSNTTENTHNDLFSTLEKESGSNINSNINSGETGAATGVASRPGSRNAQIIASKSNENYDKYCQHLIDQASYLTYKINEYKSERDKLLKRLDESKTDERYIYIDKLEKEIKGYKNMAESCVKTCSQLAEEVIILRKEIDKYTSSQNMSLSYSSSFAGLSSVSKEKNSNISATPNPRVSSSKKMPSISPLKYKGKSNVLKK